MTDPQCFHTLHTILTPNLQFYRTEFRLSSCNFPAIFRIIRVIVSGGESGVCTPGENYCLTPSHWQPFHMPRIVVRCSSPNVIVWNLEFSLLSFFFCHILASFQWWKKPDWQSVRENPSLTTSHWQTSFSSGQWWDTTRSQGRPKCNTIKLTAPVPPFVISLKSGVPYGGRGYAKPGYVYISLAKPSTTSDHIYLFSIYHFYP